MSLKLLAYLFFYSLLICKIFYPQRQYVHSHCQIINAQKSQLQKNQIIDCIACLDVNSNPSDNTIKSGLIRFNQLPENFNKNKINGYVYLQSQCMEYECQQMQKFQDFTSKFNNKNLIAFGFDNTIRMQTKNFTSCQYETGLNQFYGQNSSNCLQFNHELISKYNTKKIYSLMTRFKYEVPKIDSSKSGSSTLEPPSVYFTYVQYGTQSTLIIIALAFIILSLSQSFFKDVLAQKYPFFSSGTPTILLFLTIITGYYLTLWNKKWITLIYNSYFIYVYLRIVSDTQSMGKLWSRILALGCVVFWFITPIKFSKYQEDILLAYGLVFTALQLFFIKFVNQYCLQKILTLVIVGLLATSFMFIYLSPFNQMAKIFLRNIPMVQFLLLVAIYQSPSTNKQIMNKNQPIFPAHHDLQDLELKINRELGF